MRKLIILLMSVSLAGLLPIACGQSSDDRITAAVTKKLQSDTTIPAASLDVKTKNGVVQVYGDVYGQESANRAVQLAQSVPGVHRVDSKLTVHPLPVASSAQQEQQPQQQSIQVPETGTMENLSPKDASIVAQIKQKFSEDPALQALNISVTSSNGVAVLNGAVNQDSEAQRAVTVAKSVPDVKKVQSNLKVSESFVVPQG